MKLNAENIPIIFLRIFVDFDSFFWCCCVCIHPVFCVSFVIYIWNDLIRGRMSNNCIEFSKIQCYERYELTNNQNILIVHNTNNQSKKNQERYGVEMNFVAFFQWWKWNVVKKIPNIVIPINNLIWCMTYQFVVYFLAQRLSQKPNSIRIHSLCLPNRLNSVYKYNIIKKSRCECFWNGLSTPCIMGTKADLIWFLCRFIWVACSGFPLA